MNHPHVPKLGARVDGKKTHFATATDAATCSVRLYGPSGELVEEHELVPCGDEVFALDVDGAGHGKD